MYFLVLLFLLFPIIRFCRHKGFSSTYPPSSPFLPPAPVSSIVLQWYTLSATFISPIFFCLRVSCHYRYWQLWENLLPYCQYRESLNNWKLIWLSYYTPGNIYKESEICIWERDLPLYIYGSTINNSKDMGKTQTSVERGIRTCVYLLHAILVNY